MELFPRTLGLVSTLRGEHQIVRKLNQAQRTRPERAARLIEKGYPTEILERYSNVGLVALECVHTNQRHVILKGESEVLSISNRYDDIAEADDELGNIPLAEE